MCTLEGVVVKATTGRPLKRILVALYPLDPNRESRATVSEASGRFVIAGVAPGRYTIQARGNGYSFQAYGQQQPGGPGKVLTLAPGQHEKDIVFRLMPPGVITGTVYDEDGDPVTGANVQAMRSAQTGGRRQMVPAGGAQTNDLGEYRIYGLESGDYYIVAHSPRTPVVNEPSDEVYLPTFHPNTADPTQATLIQLPPGAEVQDINVDLRLVRGVRLSGRVLVEGAAKSIQGAYVSLVSRDPAAAGYQFAGYGTGVEDDKGTFEMRGVPPGSYYLTGGWGDAQYNYSGRVPVDVGSAGIEGITLIIGPGVDLRGHIRTDPPAQLNFNTVSLWLQSTDSTISGGSTEIKPDGTFVVHNLYDGNYRLHVGGFPEEFYLRSARMGGSEVLETGLTITHTEPPGALDMVLTQNGGRIDGTVVHHQKPAAGAIVVLVPDPPDRNRGEMYSSKRTDQMGRFSLRGLPPGDFKLFAWERLDGVAFNDPEFLKPYDDRGTPVHIEEKKEQYVQLDLIPAEEEKHE
jgi:protocatechuate 3,4-dioxygenase beta subunit